MAEETNNKIKRQSAEWEDIFTDTSDKSLISNIYKEFIKLNTKKNAVQLKNGQRTWIDSSSKKTYWWPVDIWKDAQCQ